MLKIGRYGIASGWAFWVQTRVPTRIWHFLFIWVTKEAHPQDVDRKPQFPPGTPMTHEGRVYRYYRAGGVCYRGDGIVEGGEDGSRDTGA